MYGQRMKYRYETCHRLSIALPSRVGQKTKIMWSKFDYVGVKGDNKLRRSDLIKDRITIDINMVIKPETNFLSEMTAVYRRCF